MFRFILLSAVIGIALSTPVEVKKIKTRKIYSLNGIVGGQQRAFGDHHNENVHVKYAPQDPFVGNDESPETLSRADVGPAEHNHHQEIVHQPQHHQQQHHQQQHHNQHKPANRPTTTTTPRSYGIDYDELNKQQAQHAHYSFDASIQDDINDHSHTRSEQRDGLKVTGMYSYSDGFFHRTVEYIADENGYRVVKESAEKIGEGPQFNADGVADVKGSLIGGYSIKIDDKERNPHYVGFGVNKVAN